MVNNRFDSIRRVLAEEIKPYQRQKETLFKNINAKLVIADRAYSINEALSYLNQRNIKPVIPLKSNCLDQRDYERKLYRLRRIIEKTFLALKCWRSIATCYAKTIE